MVMNGCSKHVHEDCRMDGKIAVARHSEQCAPNCSINTSHIHLTTGCGKQSAAKQTYGVLRTHEQYPSNGGA